MNDIPDMVTVATNFINDKDNTRNVKKDALDYNYLRIVDIKLKRMRVNKACFRPKFFDRTDLKFLCNSF